MTGTVATIKRRARRIAADEAHAWARNLRIRNPYAKLVLCMITQYVSGEGTCFVGVKALADDCELADETIRRRLGWLEGVGAITRMPQWVDESGRRNSEGHGRRTTDEIRLMLDADEAVIEARAAGDTEPEAETEDHPPQAVTLHAGRGSNPSPTPDNQAGDGEVSRSKNLSCPSISPLATPSLRTGPNDSNLNQKVAPLTPLAGGIENDIGDQENETKTWQHVETWAKFETAWRDPILHQQICRQIWSAFTDTERETAIRVARGYHAWRGTQKHPPNMCNPQKILRELDAWPRYAELAGPDPALRTFIAEGTREFDGCRVLSLIGGWSLPPLQINPKNGTNGFWRSRPPPPDLIGLANFSGVAIEQWKQPEDNSPSYFAWRRVIDDWTGQKPTSFKVPAKFPPRKDGSINPSDVPLATDEDLKQFGQIG